MSKELPCAIIDYKYHIFCAWIDQVKHRLQKYERNQDEVKWRRRRGPANEIREMVGAERKGLDKEDIDSGARTKFTSP